MKRLLTIALALCLLAGQARAEIIFAYWGGEAAQSAVNEALEKYNKKSTLASAIAFDSREEYVRALPTLSADVLLLDPALLYAQTRDGASRLANIEDYAGIIELENFAYVPLRSLTVNDTLLGVPVSGGARLYLWNGAAPADEIALAQAAADWRAGGGEALVAVDAPGCALLLIARLQSLHGRDWLTEKGEVAFSQEEIEAACRWLQSLMNAGVFAVYADPLAPWSEGRCAAVWIDCADAPAYQAAAPEGAAVTLLSHIASSLPFEGDMQWAGRALGISAASANAPQAAGFIQFLLNSDKGARALADAFGTPLSADGMVSANRYRLLDASLTAAAKEALSWGRYALPYGFSAHTETYAEMASALPANAAQAARLLREIWE
ncbi:MAG: hypothetical protein PHY12_05360 [Eubacteriales bacterium]|nr:hypothetical protein [Eubacteriales bacterium]